MSKVDLEFMNAFVEAVRQLVLSDGSILDRATPRWEYRKCRNGKHRWFSTCQKCRYGEYCQGPYLYLYWKENGKLRKKYLGKGPEEYLLKKVEKCYSQYAHLGNQLPQPGKVSTSLNDMDPNLS